MFWSPVKSKAHAGETLPQVLFKDADWFFWMLENNKFTGSLASEAALLALRARYVRPLASKVADPVIEYYFTGMPRKFSHFDVVPRSRPLHEGSSLARRLDLIDMGIVYRMNPYDKLGNKSFVDSMRRHVFGNSSYRITKARAEAFFADAANFGSAGN